MPGLLEKMKPAIERFRRYCRFDPTTGCVLWIGGTTAGHGNSARYGAFWFEGRRWAAHRWAAFFIHGLDVGEHTVGHCCPSGPNTLCVQHLTVQTLSENVIERNKRVARCNQTAEEKQYWVFVSKGIEPAPRGYNDPVMDAVPFYTPPDWLNIEPPSNNDECPF